jgi:hypothetical protein
MSAMIIAIAVAGLIVGIIGAAIAVSLTSARRDSGGHSDSGYWGAGGGCGGGS